MTQNMRRTVTRVKRYQSNLSRIVAMNVFRMHSWLFLALKGLPCGSGGIYILSKGNN